MFGLYPTLETYNPLTFANHILTKVLIFSTISISLNYLIQ